MLSVEPIDLVIIKSYSSSDGGSHLKSDGAPWGGIGVTASCSSIVLIQTVSVSSA